MQQKILIGLVLTLIIVIFIPLYWAAEPGRQEAARERQQAEAVEREARPYMPQKEGSFRVEVSLNGFNNTPGEFRLEVEGGQEVEITFVYGDYDLPVNNPHIIAIPDLGITPFILDQNNPEFTVSFTAPKVGEVTVFSFMCTQTACAGHNNLLGGIIVIQPSQQEAARERQQAEATEVGQAIFEQSCKSCHSIGGGRIVGPDLKGVVERRERDWLVRFIVSPDKLIAQGDPIAKQLVEQYGTPMPNMGLSEQEAEQALAYIEAQSGEPQSSPSPE